MKKIYKHVVEVVVLSEDESLERCLGSEWELSDLEQAISTGDCIGTYSHKETQELPADEVETELIAIGNDGTFFDDLD